MLLLGLTATAMALVIGVAIAVIAIVRLSNTTSSPMLPAVNVVLGAWMIAAAWVFGYAHWGRTPSRRGAT